jgi:hypothetical protein
MLSCRATLENDCDMSRAPEAGLLSMTLRAMVLALIVDECVMQIASVFLLDF